MSNPEMRSKIILGAAGGITAFVVYLLMRKYVLSDRVDTTDYIIGGAVGLGIMISQFFLKRKR